LTGKTTAKRKAEIINDFRAGRTEVLVATATLATGTDGLDKVCDRLLIVQDTQDDSLRRQLVGRILPRGDADDSDKEFYRLQLPPVPKK
jgi:superfamily II DNA or RNA helicase